MASSAGLDISIFDGLTGSSGKGQEEGQEDQGKLKQLGWSSLVLENPPVVLTFLLAFPWAPCQAIKLAYAQVCPLSHFVQHTLALTASCGKQSVAVHPN